MSFLRSSRGENVQDFEFVSFAPLSESSLKTAQPSTSEGADCFVNSNVEKGEQLPDYIT